METVSDRREYMAEDEEIIIHYTPTQRAAQARRRAQAAQVRLDELRDRRREGVGASASQQHEDLRSAAARARQAHHNLLAALESSALAHEHASATFSERANGDPHLEAKAKDHLVWAAADRERAGRLRGSPPQSQPE